MMTVWICRVGGCQAVVLPEVASSAVACPVTPAAAIPGMSGPGAGFSGRSGGGFSGMSGGGFSGMSGGRLFRDVRPRRRLFGFGRHVFRLGRLRKGLLHQLGARAVQAHSLL